jgi:WD40 repeat protein
LASAWLVLAALAVPWVPPADARPDGLSPAQAKAEAALKDLRERVRTATGDPEPLCQELRALRLSCPGTDQAIQAASLLARLASPLDRLDPAAIPALERFDWQPKELVAVLGEHRGRHGRPVMCVAFSPDGALAASGGHDLVRLWDPATLRLKAVLPNGYSVMSIAFSSDSKALVVGTSTGSVHVWDLAKDGQGKLRHAIQAATSPVYSVAFQRGNKIIAAGCFDNITRLYDVSGAKVNEAAQVAGHTKAVYAVACSPDGKILATGSLDGTVRLWNLDSGKFEERSLLEGHETEVTALAFTPRGHMLATASADGIVRLWTIPAGTRPRERIAFKIGGGHIYSLSFSDTGQTLAVACADGSVRLWTVTGAPRERARLDGHAAAVTGVAYSPDKKTLLSGSLDWTVRSWDLSATPKPKDRFQPWSHLSHVYSVALSPDGKTLVSGSEDKVVRVWDLTRQPLRTRSFLKGDSVAVYSVAFSPDGRAVAAAGNHTTVRQWEAATGQSLRPCTGHPGRVSGILYSPDGRQLLTRSGKSLLLFDAHKGLEIRRFEGHQTDVHCLALSPDGRRALSGSGTYLLKDGKYVYNKDGTYVFTDCLVNLWDVDSGYALFTDKSHTLPIYSVGFSTDNRLAFSGPYKALLERWEVRGGSLAALPEWKGSSGYVQSLTCSPDGQSLVTTGLDGKIILWDLPSGKRVKEWSLNEQLGCVTVSADSRHLAVSLATGVIYLLRLAPPTSERGPSR